MPAASDDLPSDDLLHALFGDSRPPAAVDLLLEAARADPGSSARRQLLSRLAEIANQAPRHPRQVAVCLPPGFRQLALASGERIYVCERCGALQ